MRVVRVLLLLAVLFVLVCAGFVALTWKSEIARIARPEPGSFDPKIVKRGAELAAVGNCIACHTVPGGTAFAGGLGIPTQFGTIYSTNITPDEKTGIGSWSEEAFARAMREGTDRDGTHLYPAFPYDHFSRMTDSDLDALYAFLMTRPATRAEAPANQLVWPLSYRPVMAAWNLLYLHKPSSGEMDRGQYLAEGLAHCGACHTPRNSLGAEKSDQAYDGGWSDGWYAPALNAHSPAVRAWTEQELFAYLRTGFSASHAAAAGPMAEVTQDLAEVPEADVHALASYFAGLMAKAPATQHDKGSSDNKTVAEQKYPDGATLFAGACATCHDAGAPMMQQGRPPLARGTSLHEDAPHDTLHVIVRGLAPPRGRAGPSMPAFGNDFTDRQLAEIAAYLRARFTDLPPWQNVEQAAREVRKGTEQ
jgi:mono/diheme cytochrome c family protein